MSSLPLVSFLITLLLAAAVCTHGQVVTDTNGNRVRINDQYFIQPVNTGNNGGGLVPLATKISLCLLGITQALPSERGVRVSFSYPPTLIPPLLPFAPVFTNSDITIEFKSNICKDISKFWEVDGSALVSEEPAIQIGGNPRRRNSRFRIEKVGEEGRTNIYRFTTSDGTVGVLPGALDSSQLVLTNDVAKTIFVKFIKFNAVTNDVVTSTSRVEKLGLRMIL